MDFIVSLAHFCEQHGPTTVLCTQLSPIQCPTCFPVSISSSPESLSKNASFSSGFWEPPSPIVTPGTGPLFSPFTSPPTSPRSPGGNHNPYFANVSSDNASGRRFSFGSETEGDACDSCNLMIPVPKLKVERSPKDIQRPGNFTVLRSSHSIAAVGAGPGSDDEEVEEDESPTEEEKDWSGYGSSPTPSHNGSTGSPDSAPLYPPHHTHTHKLTYVTRRQPESQSIYSRLRHSCIRTLSSESLPRGSACGAFSFGDPIAGHTIAYIFRLPDPRARGKRRTYALTALVGDNCRAMSAFVPITKAFEAIASHIISMTDRVLERESALVPKALSPDLSQTPPMSASLPLASGIERSPTSPVGDRWRSSANSPVSSHRPIADVSSFLSAKKVDPDGYPRMSREVMRAKGLPEIVGKEDFFADLHLKFCHILYELLTKLPR